MRIDWCELGSKEEEYEKAAWGSRRSQESRFKSVTRVLEPLQPGAVLDVGCGTGEFERWFRRKSAVHHRFLGVDLCGDLVRQAREKGISNTVFEVADASCLPFYSNAFQYTISVGLLDCCSDPLLALKEATRVTWKKLLVITLSKYTDFKHPLSKYFDPYQLRKQLIQLGWPRVELTGLDTRTGQTISVLDTHAIQLVASR